jgi:hypothetical protein
LRSLRNVVGRDSGDTVTIAVVTSKGERRRLAVGRDYVGSERIVVLLSNSDLVRGNG